MMLCSLFSYASDFDNALTKHGIIASECSDLSAETKIKFGIPQCMYVNIRVTRLPTQKGYPVNGHMDVYDGNGHYFSLPVSLDVQGNSSTGFVKKNFAVSFFTDEAHTTSPDITIGDWVAQDGFHLKAYYLEKFRGAAVVGYHLFDDIIADHNTYQDRAGLSKTTKARCYPDGFPCIVYHNGSFYGIYAFQLKKHRKNFNLDKAKSSNVHLDGQISDRTFWKGNIGSDWTLFEVRNPKTLYDVNGNEYNGDSPKELMGSNSYYYDATNPDMVATAETKNNILKLSKYCGELDAVISNRNNTKEDIRAEIAKRFDVPGMIDYMIHAIVINNFDGFRKNWQWFTYDGKKWFVAPYDLDCTFGNYWNGSCIMDADKVTVEKDDNNYQEFDHFGMFRRIPFTYVEDYFADEMKARYELLRNDGVLTKENILTKYKDWADRVGEDNYTLEWNKWPDAPCINKYQDSMDRVSKWLDDRFALADGFAGTKFYTDIVRGDLVADGVFDVYDYTKLLSRVCKSGGYGTLATTRENLISDVNRDRRLDVSDLVAVVNLIMESFHSNAAKASAKAADKEDTIEVRSEGSNLTFCLNSDREYVALQLDVVIPDATVSQQTLLDRASRHNITVSKISDDTYRILLVSMANNTFSGTTGDLFRLSLSGNGDGIAVKSAIASTIDAYSHVLTAGSVVSVPTAITTSAAKAEGKSAVYNISGQQQASMCHGINIVRMTDGSVVKIAR